MAPPPAYLSQFTTYNVLATAIIVALRFVLGAHRVPRFALDTVRTTSALIAAAVITIYVAYGPSTVRDVYRHLQDTHPILIHMRDAVWHFLPPLLLGGIATASLAPVFLGASVLFLWYAAVRPHIQTVYTSRIPHPTGYDQIMAIVLCTVAVLIIVNKWRL